MDWMMVIQKSTEALKRLFERSWRPERASGEFMLLRFAEVLPGMFLGSCPTSVADVRRLRGGLGITAVLNLQTEEDFARWDIDWRRLEGVYLEEGIVVERVPIRDFDGEHLLRRVSEAADRLSVLAAVGHRVYVHCTAGRQRSPSVVIAHLVSDRGLSLEDAAAKVRMLHRCDPDMSTLKTALGDAGDAS